MNFTSSMIIIAIRGIGLFFFYFFLVFIHKSLGVFPSMLTMVLVAVKGSKANLSTENRVVTSKK